MYGDSRSMRAAWYDENGPANKVLKLGDMPTPEAGPGEVRVRVMASGINPADVKLRSGTSNYGFAYPRVTPNSDGAGVIDQIGPDVPPSWMGKRVWLFNGQRVGRAFGTGAEYIALSANLVTPLPDHVSFAEGATLGIPGMTAYHAVFGDGPVAGKTVLVTGGAGAVGFYAVALAAWGGARVLATVSGPEKAARAISGGAEATINYREEDVAERVMALTDGAGADRVVSVDFGGDMKWLPDAVALNGSVSTYASDGDRMPALPVHKFMRRNILIRPFILNSLTQDTLNRTRFGMLRWTQDKPAALRPIGGRFPLEDIVAAHEAVEAGEKFGTVVVEPNGDSTS
jgi:NADPH:quinone reductase